MMRQVTFLAVAALLGGCANRIRGEIEDQEIKVKSAFFFAQPAVLGTDSLIGVVLTDLPDGCASYSAFVANAPAAAAPADKAALWASTFPADFWDITFLLRVTDPNVPLTGQAFTGIAWDQPLDQVQKAQGYFTHNIALRDAAFYDGTADADLYRKNYLSNGGTLEVNDHDPASAFKGRFATFTVNPESGAPTGLLEITFSADLCPTADMLESAGLADGA